MERIIWRAAIICSVVSALMGGVLLLNGYEELAQNDRGWDHNAAIMSSPVVAECSRKYHDPDRPLRSFVECAEAWGIDDERTLRLNRERRTAKKTLWRGQLALMFAPLILICFYVLRWMFTGKWKAPEALQGSDDR